MDLRKLRAGIDAAKAAIPTPRPRKRTTAENREALNRLVAVTEIMFAVELVLEKLESWATWRPNYEPPQPTEALDAARLSRLLGEYRSAGVADESIEAALADFRERLAAVTAAGTPIAAFYTRFIDPIRAADNSAAQQATEQKEERSCH